MKTLFLKIFALYFGTIIFAAGYFYFADGYTDAFYLRFATPKQTSLILGSSRAAHGIVPDIINEKLNSSGRNISIFNYSFALGYSSFGPAYYSSIKKKLLSGIEKGIFIIEVNPWSISEYRNSEEDSTKFDENFLPTGKLDKVDEKPNFQYLIDHYDQAYINILINKIKNMELFKKKINTSELHKDGWFEVSVRMDEKSLKKREKKTLYKYTVSYPEINEFSPIRFEYLKKTISYLKERGDVYLVRLPVHDEILLSENKYMADFNDKMISLSEEFSVVYFNLSDSTKNVLFSDGNHLWKESSKNISGIIADKIVEQ
jgi:hypothetical protein